MSTLVTKLRDLKKGDLFKITFNGPIYVRGYFERSPKKFEVYRYDNICRERFLIGIQSVIIDF
nr:MAG TPA: hypothetical protein [Microviridae sp.]